VSPLRSADEHLSTVGNGDAAIVVVFTMINSISQN
jgi:hypothetical protein